MAYILPAVLACAVVLGAEHAERLVVDLLLAELAELADKARNCLRREVYVLVALAHSSEVHMLPGSAMVVVLAVDVQVDAQVLAGPFCYFV